MKISHELRWYRGVNSSLVYDFYFLGKGGLAIILVIKIWMGNRIYGNKKINI